MDILRLVQDFNIDYVTEGHKHTRPGWLNVKCPFCTGHEGYHLGWNSLEEYWYCWRCGWHPPVQTVANLINKTTPETAVLLQRYGNVPTTLKTSVKREEMPFLLPTGLTPLTPQHKSYLTKRGYDADMLEKKWGIMSTGPMSRVGVIPYKHRIFIPYNWNGQMVTFDTRDVTGKAETKYQACPVDREIMARKKMLYGNQEAWGSVGICVEGVFDVWRFGDAAFATSGINFTPTQVRLIAKIFKHVYIVYDSRSSTSKELQAAQQARKLSAELRIRGVKSDVVNIEGGGDPSDMPQEKADKFINSILS